MKIFCYKFHKHESFRLYESGDVYTLLHALKTSHFHLYLNVDASLVYFSLKIFYCIFQKHKFFTWNFHMVKFLRISFVAYLTIMKIFLVCVSWLLFIKLLIKNFLLYTGWSKFFPLFVHIIKFYFKKKKKGFWIYFVSKVKVTKIHLFRSSMCQTMLL